MAVLTPQFGIVSETTYGQEATVTRFYPFLEENIAQTIDRIDSGGFIAGTRVMGANQWRAGNVHIAGDIGMELWQQGSGLLFQHMLGTVSSSTAGGVATHTFSPGDLSALSFTAQVGRPTASGTVIPFTYGGCKIQSWELAGAAGEIVTLGLSLLGQTETTGISLATASYITDVDKPYTMIDASAITVGGSSACVRNFTLSGNNNLSDDRFCIGQNYIDQPQETDFAGYSGTLTLDFTDTGMYQRFVDASTASIVLSLSAAANAQATVTLNARFDGTTPAAQAKGLIVYDVPFTVVRSSTTDASALTVVMKNSQTSP
jgi:hypothetical protein